MTEIPFNYEHPNFVSTIFNGGVQLQVTMPTDKPTVIALDTRLSADNGWATARRLTVTGTLVFSIFRYADGQQFRIRSFIRPAAVSSTPVVIPESPETAAVISDLSQRMIDLEEGNEPLVLSIDVETGNLEQEGVSSGTFGIDYDSGYLYFES